ncbi:MAG TPA: adenylosuccinate lyase [Lacibacter sp.]|nr:adenylosuccinate lyase [Lacibacter sp.]HMO90264.1 adenylosuccinate lyase [Lacibacter sp.]HMP87210.1 adenylosuccinate lyase [Lacibacter sp.]
MELQSLTALSPVDGRYRNQLQHLAVYFSEYALIRYRVRVEVEYLLLLSKKKFFPLTAAQQRTLRAIVENFTPEQALEIKNLERVTNHDVKAVEYFLKQQLEQLQLGAYREWVHFGLTSQDINNTAIPLAWKEALEQEWMPALSNLILRLRQLAREWKQVPLLARTHGQPASPTRLGKELMVFVERLEYQLQQLSELPTGAKFGGATGNFNAHYAAFPQTDWIRFGKEFVEGHLGLHRQLFTTQIEHYDQLAAQMDALRRINTILIDLCRDIWTYVSLDYFKQKIKKGEVGSSAMPHKVNPIDFENAEGNLGIANALYEHLSAKLPVSRLQRDLTDSTALRNLGVPFAHAYLSLLSIGKGLNKLLLNEEKIRLDLEQNWAVVAEAIQTILRRENYPNPYEALKELTRGQASITQETIRNFVKNLKVSSAVKKELLAITPWNYTGKNPEF